MIESASKHGIRILTYTKNGFNQQSNFRKKDSMHYHILNHFIAQGFDASIIKEGREKSFLKLNW